ncbi:MAG: alpha/beta hydrolase [Alphaproteobacteria bacterium]|nr:alpha/beta hydrolase [Alphaproteobacteria bacterium]
MGQLLEWGAVCDRQDTSFASGGLRCAAWHYADPAVRSSVCIVMGHGFGATRHYGLDPYARRFRAEGYDVLLFDYRHFGESEGEPRGLIKVKRQLADWHAAIAHARSLGYERIVLWGSSFAGGHVLHVAAVDSHLSGAISQVPHISGLATSLAVPLNMLPRALGAIIADAFLRLFGRRYFIKAFGPAGAFAAMSTPGAYNALVAMLPKGPGGEESAEWRAYFERRNRVNALSMAATLFYSPGKCASQIKCPMLLQAGRKDRTTPFEPARKAAERIPDCAFRAHDVDHFDVYLGQSFEVVIAEQLDFLKHRVALTQPETPA